MEAVAKDILPDDSQVKVSPSLNFQEAQRPYSTTLSPIQHKSMVSDVPSLRHDADKPAGHAKGQGQWQYHAYQDESNQEWTDAYDADIAANLAERPRTRFQELEWLAEDGYIEDYEPCLRSMKANPEKLEQYKSLNTCEAKRQFIRSWAIKTIEEMVYKHEKAEETKRKAKASRGEGR